MKAKLHAPVSSAALASPALVALVAAFALSRLIMLFALPVFLSDTGYYLQLAREMEAGRLPFRDFPFWYPPLSVIPVYLPLLIAKIFAANPYESYRTAYATLFCALDGLTFWLLLSDFRASRRGKAGLLGLWTYVLGGLCMAEMIYDRLDLFMGLALVVALLAADWKRPIASATALASGILIKLVPIALAPFFAVFAWREGRGRERYVWTAAAIATTAIGVLASLALFGPNVGQFLEFHSKRGIQVESIWSSALWLGSQVAPNYVWFPRLELNYGAMHLAHASDALDFASNIASLALAGVVGLSALFKKKPASLARHVFACLMLMIAFGKVLSPQYLAWPLCVAPLCAFDWANRRERLQMIAFVAILAMTGLEFHSYFAIIGMNPAAWALVAIRNFALAGLALVLTSDLVRRSPA